MSQTVNIKGNVYGGGEVAQVEGDTKVTVLDAAVPEFKVDTLLSSPKYSVFGGGLGKTATVTGSTSVDVSMKKGNSLFEVVGGGMNGSVDGTCNVHIGGVTGSSIYNVYGGGYYAPVGYTSLVITGGNITNDVYGGGVMGSIVGTGANDGLASTKIGMLTGDAAVSINGNTYALASQKNQITIGGNVYGGNDVGGSVNTAQVVINGGTIEHDVYGAGNGNHPGYTNPENVEYKDSEHDDDSYKSVEGGNVYSYRPRTTNVALTIAGNEGSDFFDASSVDKVRILGRTFGGGNSCNVGNWNDDGSFDGGGSLSVTIRNHVQLGTQNDSHVEPNGLFMGSNGQYLVAQPKQDDPDMEEKEKYYHYYYDGSYKSGFADEESFKAFVNNILTWTDDVHLNIADDVEDVWLSNFVGGGFRGSMKAKTAKGKFHYSLPDGLTVAHAVIGGAFNAHIDYTKAGSTEPTYSFKGGMLAADEADRASRIHKVHADPRDDDAEYATAYFMPLQKEVDGAEDEATRKKLYSANKEKAFVYLDLKCALHPVGMGVKGIDESVHGGTVYGGCFESGNIEGDTWVNYGCYLSPLCEKDQLYDVFFNKNNNLGIYGEVADLDRNNALNVFGAGYGEGTRSMGDVYLCIQSIASQATGDDNPSANFPYIFNAFGGSNMGTVGGNVNVYYDAGVQGTLLGSLYGGGYKGKIDGNTFVELASGFIVNVYGGSRQANIGGASHVWAYDGRNRGVKDFNHLIICNMYGGNDIAGLVEGTMPAAFTASKWDAHHGFKAGTIAGKKFNSYVEVSSDDDSKNETDKFGFPLIGRVFAGGNGENWEEQYGDKPEIANALIEIAGGTTLQAFGGGNKATITKGTYIFANAETNKFANAPFTAYQKTIMQKVFFAGVPTGYKWDMNTLTMDPFHVVRMFGGNNLATMDIQPTWNLVKGRIENVYSGGNEGDMTYYNPAGKPATQKGVIGQPSGVENNADKSNANYNPRGLSITIDQPDIHIGSLFGGCRISDVNPTPKVGQPAWPEGDDGEDFYGATINVLDGYIENIYGGNDISGTVHHGTNVNLSGAVSGNVYGSGNGHYLYKYNPEVAKFEEKVEVNEETGHAEYLYYDVPGDPGASDTKKLLTINSLRPSVEKAFLNISGNAESSVGAYPARMAYVKGNVYCGGNASTVEGPNSFTKFKIGSYVTLNGVFMGCDGAAYTEKDEIAKFAEINGITDMGANTDAEAFEEFAPDVAAAADDASHNPILLNVYMKAVDMKALPKDFNLNKRLAQAHIGTFCAGGNRGSMLTDKTVSLTFHNSLLIYDKIVAGCMDANVKYAQSEGDTIVSNGGFTRAIADNGTYGNTKIDLTIASHFIPVVMDVPADKNPDTKNSHKENFETAKKHNFLYSNFSDGEIWDYEEFNELYEGHWVSQQEFEESGESFIYKVAPSLYAPTCNIYGGCYQSGDIVGDVNIKLHSNMLRYVNQTVLDESNAAKVACFNVYGAGFGQNSHVWGNVNITMDRCLDTDIMSPTIASSPLTLAVREQFAQSTSIFNLKMYGKRLYSGYNANGENNVDASYPSANNIFGGGRNGQLIGNSTIEVRNGMVFADVAGGCYASYMYGSSHVVVGYPKYYKCNASAEYDVQRGDNWNKGKKDIFGDDLIKKSISYLKGDLVPENVYQQIVAADGSKASKFDLIDVDPTTYHTGDGTTWDAVHIQIGKGVYGGGYSIANATAASAGAITTLKLTDDSVDGHLKNFNGRYGYDIADTKGYGGNSSVMVGDQENGTADHIRISTLIATKATIPSGGTVLGKYIKESDGRYTFQGDGPKVAGKTYYTLTGDGGIYGDGHLTFCEGFRTADVTRYGWAEGTPKHPIIMNTFQRLDLLSVNDCCLMLQGAQDFATDQLDATTYSLTRVNELRLNSTLDAGSKLGEISTPTNAGGAGNNYDDAHQRNYIALLNNVRYLGSVVTNDDFDDDHHLFHGADGNLNSAKGEPNVSYKANKNAFINAYKESTKDKTYTDQFKKRNVGTARNAIGVNNGYSLRIQNQEYIGEGKSLTSKMYYGPIVGVCEIKLLSVVEGEGGGYVFADNIHKDENHFLNTSGNFVFPGIINSDPSLGNQYVVDDCSLKHFGSKSDLTTREGDLDEAHYWYVEGNRYFFNTTLTGYTFSESIDFNLVDNDPNIILSGIEKGSKLNIKKIEWLSTHRAGYETVLQNKTNPNDTDDYEFDLQVGGDGIDLSTWAWSNDMPRNSKGSNTSPYTTGKTFDSDELPLFNIRLQDKEDNSGKGKYENHLDEPELVKIYLEGQPQDENGVWQDYEYTITLNIVYLLGPIFNGSVYIENCALPGENIGFSSSRIRIKTSELMPVMKSGWKLVPLTIEDGIWKWDHRNGVDIPGAMYRRNEDDSYSGAIPAYYKQNEYKIAFVFEAGGHEFPVFPAQSEMYSDVEEYNIAKDTSLTKDEFDALSDEEKSIPKDKRMIVVHNYHRMKDVVSKDLQVEKMPVINYEESGIKKQHTYPEAKLYIEDEEDLRAFVEYLNMSGTNNIPAGLEGLDIILQKDITLTKKLPAISNDFAGTFHGDGYHIDLGNYGTSLFGGNLVGKVYNLGVINGTVASTGTVVNSYDSKDFSDSKVISILNGAKAYQLSHKFKPEADGYVEQYYSNGDYQYATTNRAWSLRTGKPNYGSSATRHNTKHTHDAARWNETDGVNVPLYDGTKTLADSKLEGVSVADVVYTKGIAEGYANDYLFFGQHLDMTSADAYPMHINQIATGDANEEKGGNRVYETAGYYQSKVDQKFYYNKDAWVFNPTFTAIDYTAVTTEGDNAVTLPTKFNVDSNKDGALVYSNETTGHVTQNLLVYNAGKTADKAVFDKKDVNNIAEKNVVYHNIVKGNDGKFSTDYFRLVDKQDFNAPIAFNVAKRAWYERQPQNYRSGSTMAWEGICIPFTAKEVYSMVENPDGGADIKSVISHFYGAELNCEPSANDHTLHHEYWLNGMVGSASGVAFARPSTDGEGLFTSDKQEAGNYVFQNDYFVKLLNYGGYYGTRDDDVYGDDKDQPWYATSHTFENYVYLSNDVPYVVAFPGEDYYEFNLTNPVVFENSKATIKVSDDNKVTSVAGAYTHNGTYLHRTDADYVIDADGNGFENTAGSVTTLPFRTYITMESSSPARERYIPIGAFEPDDEFDEEGDSSVGRSIKMYGRKGVLIIEANFTGDFRVYSTSGQYLRTVHVEAGINHYDGFSKGVYVVGKTKVAI